VSGSVGFFILLKNFIDTLGTKKTTRKKSIFHNFSTTVFEGKKSQKIIFFILDKTIINAT
jgi:hypothetical protein